MPPAEDTYIQESNHADRRRARAQIDELDLSTIITTMCAPTYCLPRWQYQAAVQCSKLYKRFLFLLYKHRTIALVPTRDIDEFWHNHILDTRAYHRDCNLIFGYYLHHIPWRGHGSAPAEHDLAAQFLLTKQYYLAEYGESLELVVRT